MVPKELGAVRNRRRRIVRKRRVVFERLLVAAAATLLLGLIPAFRFLLLVHVALDIGIVMYVARLLQWKRDEAERARVLRHLPVEDDLDGGEVAHDPFALDDDDERERLRHFG